MLSFRARPRPPQLSLETRDRDHHERHRLRGGLIHLPLVSYPERKREVNHLIEMLPLGLVLVDREAVERAAEIKVNHPIAYGDAFAAVLAEEGAILVTKDGELEAMRDRVEVLWM